MSGDRDPIGKSFVVLIGILIVLAVIAWAVTR